MCACVFVEETVVGLVVCYITAMRSAYPGGTVGMDYSNRLNNSSAELAEQEILSEGDKMQRRMRKKNQ